jgi:hypothetical protein
MPYASELELEEELEFEAPRPPKISVRYVKAAAEMEVERFDPAPPRPGTIHQIRIREPHTLAAHRTLAARVAKAAAGRMAALPSTGCVFLDIEGHEDEVGDPARYGRLGADRAKAIAGLILAALRTEIARLPAGDRRNVVFTISSAEPVRPIRSNVTDEGRALNRRVEVRGRTGQCPVPRIPPNVV